MAKSKKPIKVDSFTDEMMSSIREALGVLFARMVESSLVTDENIIEVRDVLTEASHVAIFQYDALNCAEEINEEIEDLFDENPKLSAHLVNYLISEVARIYPLRLTQTEYTPPAYH